MPDPRERGSLVDGEEDAAEEVRARSLAEVLLRVAYRIVELGVVGLALLTAVRHVAFRADHGCDLGTCPPECGIMGAGRRYNLVDWHRHGWCGM